MGLLATAAMLEPDPQGFGTHQQLGLPACSFKVFVGFRCPSCGMTTSWSLFTKGRIFDSLAANAGGALLALSSLLIGPWALLSAMIGRPWGKVAHEWWLGGISTVILLVTMIDWMVRIVFEK